MNRSRRALLKGSLLAGLGAQLLRPLTHEEHAQAPGTHHGGMTTMGEVDHQKNGFDPYAFPTHWAALLLGIGAGVILQVIVEMGAHHPGRVALPQEPHRLRPRPRPHVRHRVPSEHRVAGGAV